LISRETPASNVVVMNPAATEKVAPMVNALKRNLSIKLFRPPHSRTLVSQEGRRPFANWSTEFNALKIGSMSAFAQVQKVVKTPYLLVTLFSWLFTMP